MPVEDAVELFLTDQGYLPRRTVLERYARERKFSLQSVPPNACDEVFERVRERRAESGPLTPCRVAADAWPATALAVRGAVRRA